jgi:hypothetical protein
MVLAAVLFGIAALGGAFLLSLRLRGGNPPIAFAFVHGAVAVAGFVALAVAVATSPAPRAPLPIVALVALASAACVGLWLVSRHGKGILIPLPIAWLHAALAAVGYVILLAAILA